MIIFTILYFILSTMFFFTPINMNSPTAGHLDTSYKLSEHVGYVVWSMHPDPEPNVNVHVWEQVAS